MFKNAFETFLVIMTICALHPVQAGPVARLGADIGQKCMPLEYQENPVEPDSFFHIQWTRQGDDRLFLTANNVFFNAVNRLVCRGDGLEEVKQDGVSHPDYGNRGLNNRSSYAYVTRWNDRDIAEWGIWLEETGVLEVHVNTGGAAGAKFSLEIAGQAKDFESAGVDDDSIHLASSLEFEISEPGFHEVVLRSIEAHNNLRLHWIEIGGPAAKGGGVARTRWRPNAGHAQFSSSAMDDSSMVRMWVMELDAVPGTHNFYGPITTPFGYYGSSWLASGVVSRNLVFSLWSFGSRAEEPPIEQLSQILATGNPEARFGGFSHEGTGAKIRNWQPFAGLSRQRQAYALRVEPGIPTEAHDTYYAYFYDYDQELWILYGVGEKFNQRRVRRDERSEDMSMRIGSFVEVVGGARRERSGIYERRQRYRGWIMDQNGEWYDIDRMTYRNVNPRTGLTHTQRGVDENGWFFNQTGGWLLRKPTLERGELVATPNPSPMSDVDFLGEEHLETLMTVPSAIEVSSAEAVTGGLRLHVSARNAGEENTITAFWGDSDSRALKDRWAESAVVAENVPEGDSHIAIPMSEIDGDVYVRLLLRNEEGQFFSRETFKFEAD